MTQMMERQLEVLWSLARPGAIGTGLVLGCLWVGWVVGLYTALPPVRLIEWWVNRVVIPLIRSGSWPRRTAVIFTNNTSISAALVAMGASAVAAWIGVACLGLSLGVGLRRVSMISWDFMSGEAAPHARVLGRTRIGFALNMLEPPAIVVTIGLALGRHSIPASLSMSQAWETFGICVVPALLVAACGEALWLGAISSTKVV